MRIVFSIILGLLAVQGLMAQRACSSFEYAERLLQSDPALREAVQRIERHTAENLAKSQTASRQTNETLITIPVVVHVLYRNSSENISDAQVQSQITMLNAAFRKRNADIGKTPAHFAPLAADINIEFCLAKINPQGRITSGITRKYTSAVSWTDDDRMKFNSNGGQDAWNPDRYLNIWVCNMGRLLGYSSLPGGPASKDGIVIHYAAFGTTGVLTFPYNEGKTAVHEIGHWLNLKHLWGDQYCGDDLVFDTPRQRGFTSGCPTGIRPTCDSGPFGDMYMNYMDFTNDACLVMFSQGQKSRMRSLFEPGGARYSIQFSNACTAIGLPDEGPLPDDGPKTPIRLYPNPATDMLTIELAEIPAGGQVLVIDARGAVVMKLIVNGKITRTNISALAPGMYMVRAGEGKINSNYKFLKL